MVDCRVACLDPADVSTLSHLQRKGETFFAKPQPDPAYRSRFGKSDEDTADGCHDRLIGMKAHFAILFAPNESDR